MKRLNSIILVSALTLLTACTEPGQKTMVSAAAGGALGAGLGAIIGNQVGSTGAGIAIGAAGGAAAGAAVGNALEAQDKKLDSQAEVIQRREEAIQAQRTEITELRKMNQDTATTMGESYAWNGSSDVSGVRHASPSEIAAARQRLLQGSTSQRPSPVTPPSTEARAQLNSRTIAQPAMPQSQKAVNARTTTESIKSPSTSVVERDLVTPPAEEVVTDTASSVNRREVAPEIVKVNENNPAKEPVLPPVEESAPPVVAETAKLANTDSSECGLAVTEVTKAEQMADTADKLFHLRRALRMCPTNADYHNKLGELYVHLGRASDATFEFNEALKINPQHAAAKENLEKQNRSASSTSNSSRGGSINAVTERY